MSGVKGNGLKPRLIAFFERNPTEMLSAKDVAVKYDVDIRYARNVLSELRAEGVAERVTVWRLNTEP